MNNIVITGRVVRKPTLDTSTQGKKYTKFTVAQNRNKDVANFFSCIAWNEQAEHIAKFVDKGSQVLVLGSMESRKYQAEGKERTLWEIFVSKCEFLSNKFDKNEEEPSGEQSVLPDGSVELKQEDITSDELPF